MLFMEWDSFYLNMVDAQGTGRASWSSLDATVLQMVKLEWRGIGHNTYYEEEFMGKWSKLA